METTKVLRLKEEYRKAILTTPKLQGDIATACNKSISTICRWATTNAEQLVMLSVLQTLRKHFKVAKSIEMVEEIEVSELKAA